MCKLIAFAALAAILKGVQPLPAPNLGGVLNGILGVSPLAQQYYSGVPAVPLYSLQSQAQQPGQAAPGQAPPQMGFIPASGLTGAFQCLFGGISQAIASLFGSPLILLPMPYGIVCCELSVITRNVSQFLLFNAVRPVDKVQRVDKLRTPIPLPTRTPRPKGNDGKWRMFPARSEHWYKPCDTQTIIFISF